MPGTWSNVASAIVGNRPTSDPRPEPRTTKASGRRCLHSSASLVNAVIKSPAKVCPQDSYPLPYSTATNEISPPPVRRKHTLRGLAMRVWLFASVFVALVAAPLRAEDKVEPKPKIVKVGNNVVLEIAGEKKRVIVKAEVCLTKGP